MITVYKSDGDGRVSAVPDIVPGSWINLAAPTEDEIQRVVTALNLPLDFIKDPLDEEERSRIEKDDDNILIIVNMPFMTKDDKGIPFFDTLPLGIVITDQHFVTVCLRETPMFEAFTENKVRSFFTFKKTRFAFQILYFIATSYLRFLKQISKSTDDIEKELHKTMRNQELYKLLNLETSLVYFTTSLKSNNIVMQKMLKSSYLRMYEDDQDLLEDVIIENQQAIETAETHMSILRGMMSSYSSVISNNLNIVMKFLTSITILLALPTMVSSFYGMNVDLPFMNNPMMFGYILLFCIFISSVTAFIFWKKNYF